MIQRLYYCESSGFDPYRNLAIEECLLEQVNSCAILYLWQNENTVVIGKNQNPWKECKTALLTQEGGKLARRMSGGGAVYHDLGNLNFTILLPQQDYDADRQLKVIQQALESLGIPTERSGRNDILAQGRKFSGNAFYKNGKAAYHHGTLLVHSDLEKLDRYLSPSRCKLQSKGVDSVRSRVGNLAMWKPDISIAALKEALKQSFSQVYHLPLEPMPELDSGKMDAMTRRNASWNWNYGKKMAFTCSAEARFPWGEVEVSLILDSGMIKEVKIYTDAMETAWRDEMEQALTGCALDVREMERRIGRIDRAREVLSLMKE